MFNIIIFNLWFFHFTMIEIYLWNSFLHKYEWFLTILPKKNIVRIYVLYTPEKISIVPKCPYSTWILHKKIYIPYLGLNSISLKCFQSKDWKVLLFKQIELPVIKKSLEHDHSLWLSTCLYWQQWFKGSQLLFTVTVVFLHRIK